MRSTKRAALYARTSTSKQDHDLQLAELWQTAKQRGWIATEYIDTGSGKSGAKLPERRRMMDDARAGKLDVVVVWRFDRLGRSTRDLLDALENLKAWGVDFVSLREGIDTSTPTGKLMFTVIAALAEFERELIRERVRAGMQTARNKGTRIGRPRAVVNIRKAKELISQGYSQRKTAAQLGLSPRTLKRALSRHAERTRQKATSNLPSQTHENSEVDDA